MIRSLVDESSAMSMIPNELLFEIFSFLWWCCWWWWCRRPWRSHRYHGHLEQL